MDTADQLPRATGDPDPVRRVDFIVIHCHYCGRSWTNPGPSAQHSIMKDARTGKYLYCY